MTSIRPPMERRQQFGPEMERSPPGAPHEDTGLMDRATAFAREAWRRAWGIQALAAVGVALVVVSVRGRTPAQTADDLWAIGAALVLISAPPLWAALYRLQLGGSALKELGPAGLQFGAAELRLVGGALAFLFGSALAWLPVVAISALVFVLLRPLGMLSLGPLGPVMVSFIVAAAVWLACLGLYTYATARLALAPAATVGRRRTMLFAAWPLTEGQAWTVFKAWLQAQVPLALALVALVAINLLEADDEAWRAHGLWPWPDALAAGLLLGIIYAFVQAPLTTAVLGALYQENSEPD